MSEVSKELRETLVLDDRLLLEASSNVSNLANYDRLCKLTDSLYVICQDYCCGEFWESKPSFCCPNDFRPIRNLFSYLFNAFAGLFTTIVVFLLVESVTKHYAMIKVKLLEELYQAPSFTEMRTLDRAWNSSDTSLDEDSSTDGSDSRNTRKPRLHLLKKHSQSFKEMSRLKKNRRRRKKSIHTQSS